MGKKGKGGGPSASTTVGNQASSSSQQTGPSSKSGSSKGKQPAAQAGEGSASPLVAPKPTVKQIIGGSSWTGKLPVNLFNELCQKQKWDTPDYQMHKTPDGFLCSVSISFRDPKTQEFTKLAPFRIPDSHKELLCKPTPLEARHYGATYALFRVCSTQNRSAVLPPDHRALWKEFVGLKTADVKDGKGWMYSDDPFRTHKEREAERAAAEKKRSEAKAAEAKAKEMASASGLVLRNTGNGLEVSGRTANLMRGWTNAPKIEMGKRTRIQVENLLRQGATWNPHGIQIPPGERRKIVDELSRIGFRRSHVEEATEYCKDKEETLEWLLIHVPEDDLPAWALPERYTAGVTVGATDLKKEAAIKRLAQSGYSLELCRQVFQGANGDELEAAEKLQTILMGRSTEAPQDALETHAEDEFVLYDSPKEQWEDETSSLESTFIDKFARISPDSVQIRLDDVVDGNKKGVDASIQIRRCPSYPSQLLLGVIAERLPCYIKLAIIKRSIDHIDESLKEEPMKMYLIIDWIQQNINGIIEKPGRLLDVSSVACAASETQVAAKTGRQVRRPKIPKAIEWTFDKRSRDDWLKRQESNAWKDMVKKRRTLPAWNVQESIVRTVEENHVTIISGETGSGKSTQSMQFILDDLYSRGLGKSANIIVTQPRRISALGLADRVAEERCSRVGEEIGYAIRGESRRSPDTRITFVTTGVLLRRLQVSGGKIEDVVASLADVSHIVIDEVHERSLDTDFLLTLTREIITERKDVLKLVLMSATLDASSFRHYFASVGLTVGLVEIEGRTYPVEDFFLDDIVHMTGFNPGGRLDARSLVDESVGKTIQKLGHRINYDLVVEAAKTIDSDLTAEKNPGGILVFMPGVAEINHTCNLLRSFASLYVLPLHASLETKEQKRVFARPPTGKRKIVVATNVAETSITIEDIVAVIDSGKVKETTYDPENKMRKLLETWASRAACKQRRGRAGRVQAGRCYKLFTRNLESQMAERPDPEIRRVPLEQLCLSVRAMGINDVAAFLGRSPTPPEARAVDGAIRLLQRMGALDGDEMTALGQQLSMIPADLRCGKLMVYGSIFGCLDGCITIAAILSTKSPFFSPSDRREQAKMARMTFSQGEGDLLTDLNAFCQWDDMMSDRQPFRQIRSFCEENFLSHQTLSDIANTRTQYYAALVEAGIVSPSAVAGRRQTGRSGGSPSRPQLPLLRALAAAAFSPQVARIQYPDRKFAASVSGTVELDPEARLIKYFNQENGRVFVHPSSTIFDSQGFSGGAAFMSYFSLISTSKIFIRDLTRKLPLSVYPNQLSLLTLCAFTAFNAYTLLLFAGPIELDTLGRGLLVDGWLRLRGWARIGVLVSRLRGMLDDLIARKIENPTDDVSDSGVIKAVIRLVELDGLDA